MGFNELNGKYRQLRYELEEAYSAPAWNRPRIDRIADELAATERALASILPHEEEHQMPLELS
ncbi:hypothetical protein [Rhizobacter sp. LjRoot28]|jgi:hypothetical protein|uniref:hypothetical protein n=1 Tax=Rhizobacter sp. LjRoot28 TaxID=3342309 RepID=UPI003ECDD703